MLLSGRVSVAFMALFLASGCAALIYEVVWFQQLGLSLGASAVSLAILLTSFLGGMCLGSLAYPRLAPTKWHPLVVYAALEIGLALCGTAIFWGLPALGRLYWSLAPSGNVDLALRATVAILILLPPTLLMGATLPAAARALEANPTGLARLGQFYSANTLGGVIGCLAAGLYLLRVYDTSVATAVAVALNVTVAGLAYWLSRHVSHNVAELEEDILFTTSSSTVVAVVIGLSGLTALGTEVVCTRLMALLFGPTVYTFSLILAVFLLGISLGSAAGSALSRRIRSPGLALACGQLLLALALPFAAWMIVHVLPSWWTTTRLGISVASNPEDAPILAIKIGRDLVRALATLLPATCLWGASFPLAVAAASRSGRDNGLLVGRLYAANTLGAIIGALAMSLWVIPIAGSTIALQGLTLLASGSGLLMLGALVLRKLMDSGSPGVASPQVGLCGARAAAFTAVLIAAACPYAIRLVSTVPPALLAWGGRVQEWPQWDYLFVAEGLDSPIVITQNDSGLRCFHVAGKVEASNSLSDMRTQRFLGHLPALAHGTPRRVLVIGCGSGMTAGSFLQHPSVEKVTICEIERQVTIASREHFAEYNYKVLEDPRTSLIIDDGRHFLATTSEKFDIISADPIHPWVRGAASLYTEEFYRLCREHLNPGGVVTQWIPLYESSEPAVKSEIATLLKVFPHTSLWSGQGARNGYDIVALGMLDDTRLSPSMLANELNHNEDARLSLADVGYGSPDLLLSSFAAFGNDLTDWLADAEINTDANLRLQYLAGQSQIAGSGHVILTALRAHRRSSQLKPGIHGRPVVN